MAFPGDLVLDLPLLSVFLWGTIAALVWGWGTRNAAERAFAAASILLSAGSIAEWGFLHSTDAGSAVFLYNLRTTLFSLSVLMFFYFGRWLARPRGRSDLLAVLPLLVIEAATWTVLTRGVEWTQWGPAPDRDPLWYPVWVAVVAGYLLALTYYLGWTLGHATFTDPRPRRGLFGMLLTVAGVGLLWLAITFYRVLTGRVDISLASLLLVAAGAFVLVSLGLTRAGHWRDIVRRLASAPPRPVAAILYHSTGVPLAQIVLPGAESPDAARLHDVTRALDRILADSFRSGAAALRKLEFGEQTLVIERVEHLALIVLVTGRPSDGFRRELRAALQAFEAEHPTELDTWGAAASLAESTLAVLDEVLRPMAP